jgi:hypothetical protein
MTNIIHVYVHTTHEEKISCDLNTLENNYIIIIPQYKFSC